MNGDGSRGGYGCGFVLAVALNLAALRNQVHANMLPLPVWSGVPVEAGSQLE